MEVPKKCSVPSCEENGKFKCGNCKNTNYCSKEHQKLDWKSGHKPNCFPVIFGWDPVRGNELVATRDIAQGEIILKEKALVSGPSGKADVTRPICLGCNTVMMNCNGGQQYLCSGCGWPLCNQACEKEPIHADLECQTFKAQNVSPFRLNQQYESLYILRCLLLKTLNPLKWEAFLKFESHVEERSCNLLESLLTNAAIDFIQGTCNLSGVFDKDDVKLAAGVINTNAMGEGDASSLAPGKIRKCGSYLYCLGCLICHSCTPNTYRVIQPNGELHVRAIVDIKVGDPFLTTYTDLALTTQERRTYLSKFYYFNCTCPRCSDPTEVWTFFSAVKCTSPKCHLRSVGYLLPVDPLDKSSQWKCNNCDCGEMKDHEYISNLVKNIETEFDNIPKIHMEGCLEQLENYIKKHEGISLHPNHALVYRAEYDIIQMIDYMISASLVADPSTRSKLVKRQVGLVRKSLNLMSTFWRGSSSYRGRLLYFLQNSLLRITLGRVAQNFKENKRSTAEKHAVQKEMNEIMEIRREASKILMFDPLGRDERIIAEKLESTDSPEFQIAMKYCNS